MAKAPSPSIVTVTEVPIGTGRKIVVGLGGGKFHMREFDLRKGEWSPSPRGFRFPSQVAPEIITALSKTIECEQREKRGAGLE